MPTHNHMNLMGFFEDDRLLPKQTITLCGERLPREQVRYSTGDRLASGLLVIRELALSDTLTL